ncbi:MAG: YIP1 family protein [candidate division KSB1 bacterium]|nr:YIP1 family protein [candidate division KSB1 bacterium]MDZ7305194.1 YIP1 family protein [candidate division KSB1 bacterium]MDZ7314289.1 YIP1 family protein [candidate division KSB1 bacterium]
MSIVDRIKNILFSPKTEWSAVKAESAGIQQIYLQYLLVVAALPAIGMLLDFRHRGLGTSLRMAVMGYLVTLASIYLSALIVDNLAPNFKSVRNLNNAFKLVAFAWTPSLVAMLLTFIPGLGTLLGLAGAIYSIYLFYLGLPVLMQTPQEKVVPYMIATFVVSLVVYIVLFGILGFFFSVF